MGLRQVGLHQVGSHQVGLLMVVLVPVGSVILRLGVMLLFPTQENRSQRGSCWPGMESTWAMAQAPALGLIGLVRVRWVLAVVVPVLVPVVLLALVSVGCGEVPVLVVGSRAV